MKSKASSNVQLGLFVMIGLTFLIAALYLIGSNRNLFNKTFEVNATFYNVNGLMKGNNVRLIVPTSIPEKRTLLPFINPFTL